MDYNKYIGREVIIRQNKQKTIIEPIINKRGIITELFEIGNNQGLGAVIKIDGLLYTAPFKDCEIQLDKSKEPLYITPSMTDKQADALGMIAFTFAMTKRLDERAKTGEPKYQGWHNLDTIEDLMQRLQKNVDERDMLDVANLAMMIWNKQRMAGEIE